LVACLRGSWPIQTIALVSARRRRTIRRRQINEATGMIAKTYDYLPLHDYPGSRPVCLRSPDIYDWMIAHDLG
jgi:hypothetical protein